ncbi:MAG: amino acid ABC transporter substrate-binding protein [Spirochaetia bacterium]|nr:amino acid ABC transporter substrate-binding protein [Spirochaetia bacterium]
MKKTVSLLAMLLFVGSTLIFAAGAQEMEGGDNSLDYILDKGEFVLGLDDSFPPMGFRGDDGEIVGFDIDLAKEVTSRMGVDLRLQPIDWDAKILDLNSKDIDVIWNGLTITDERMEKIEFSKPYIANRQIVIVQKDSGIDTKADLDGANVGIQLGSSAEDAVRSDMDTMETFEELFKYQDNVQALMDLEVGRIDAVVVDEILGRYYISKRPGVFDVASDFFAAEEYGIGFRKGEKAFAAEVDRILDEMIEDGTAAEISHKWFEEDILLPR